MKRSTATIVCLTLIAAVTFSCKKKEESEKPYLNGTLEFSLPPFVTAGETFDIELGGQYLKGNISRNETGGIGYYFYNSLLSTRDTVRYEDQSLTDPVRYTLAFKDTLGSFSLTCGAFANNYYTVTGVANLTLVDPVRGRTLSGIPEYADDVQFEDLRDGRTYSGTRIGKLLWMRQNLAWEGSGRAFNAYIRELKTSGTSAISTILGRFYSQHEALTACPEGWRLPTAEEWAGLGGTGAGSFDDIDGIAGKMMSEARFNGVKMWEYWRGVDMSDELHLSAIPCGYSINNVKGIYSYHGYGQYATFWTSGEYEGRGIYRYIYRDKDRLYCGFGDKDCFCASVRCVKEVE